MSPLPRTPGNLRECVSCKQCFGPHQQLCPDCFIELVTMDAIPHLLMDRYRLDRIVNRGASSLLFAAFDHEQAAPVALKLIRASAMADPRAQDRFMREAELAARFSHPGIAAVFDFGLLPDASAFVVCEFAQGVMLRGEMRRVGKFPVERAVTLLCEIAEALDEAHHAGLVHRDLKPECIILVNAQPGQQGETAAIKIVDFSFARVSGGRPYEPGKTGRLQGLGQLPARPAYLSPEQFLGAEADLRSDIFSLGVIAYEMLAGQPPFQAKRVGELAGKVLNERPASLRALNPEVSIVIEAEILRALDKEPMNRQQRAREFKQELQNTLHW
jgi:serine/threonine protein kinase